jgi:signal transducing adaptor molecule
MMLSVRYHHTRDELYNRPCIRLAKATDENLTSENWEVILNLCDKVQEEGEPGYFFLSLPIQPTALTFRSYSARNVVASVIKRLAHRSPNVQLYSLSLAESLSKNCGIDLHRELASRAFTQALEKLITDRVCNFRIRSQEICTYDIFTQDYP